MAMDNNIVDFPGAEPPVECRSDNVDERHAEAFRDLEGEVCDLEHMGEIARRLITECTAKGDDDSLHKLGLATFAVWQLDKMLREFKASYFKRYHGELTGPA